MKSWPLLLLGLLGGTAVLINGFDARQAKAQIAITPTRYDRMMVCLVDSAHVDDLSNEFRLEGDSLWQKIDSHGLVWDDALHRPNGGSGTFTEWVFVGVVTRTKTPVRRTLYTTTTVKTEKTERWW